MLNLFVWGAGSSTAIPFGSMVAVLAIWLVVSVPLTFLGAYFGFKKDKIAFPVAVGPMPRPVPAQPWYLRRAATMAIGGVLPFGTVFVEVFFIMNSLWLDTYYYIYGVLLLVFTILFITCAEIAIVLIYFQLCGEDYNWWWRSMAIPGSAGLYLFAYALFYFAYNLDFSSGITFVLYFGYMGLISALFCMLTGIVGYGAVFWFTRKIYAAVKVD